MKNLAVITVLGAIFAGYMIAMPGCGSKNNNNTVATTPYGAYNCQPGQYCPGGVINPAAGVPLLSTPTFSALDPQGQSAMILSFAAPGVVAGAPFSGQVNISGNLHLAPGACSGLYGGDFPIQGQGSWYSGYAGAIAGVQGQMQVTGGPAGAGGMVYLYPALVKDNIPQVQGFMYAVTTGYGVAVSFCNRTFAFYN